MDGIIPPQALPNPQLQLKNFGFEAQALTAQAQETLPIGTAIMAQVMGADKNGNLIIRTNGSDLILSSPLALDKGAQLQVKIDVVGGNITAELLTVDGKLPVYRPQNAHLESQKNPQEPVQLKILQVMPEGRARIAPNANPNPTPVVANIDSVNLSSSPTNNLKAMIMLTVPEIIQALKTALAFAPKSDGKLEKSLPAQLKAGMEADVKINNIIVKPPQNNAAANITNSQPKEEVNEASQTLKGQDWMKSDIVKNFNPTIKTTPEGNVEVNALVIESKESEIVTETKMGLVRISGKGLNIPRGSEIALEIQEFTKVEVESEKHPEVNSLTKQPTELKTALAQHTDHANKLAGSESKFAGKLANFINAVKSGDVENWLGKDFIDNLDDLIRNNIVNKLSTDFANFKNLLAENPLNPWQTVVFPVFDGKELHQARLHVKKFKDEAGDADNSYGTRFIVELDTSFYGEMQFDGLIRQLNPKKSFDLIIRTHSHLDAETKQEIKDIFHTTQSITGFKGGVEFAENQSFPAQPWKELMNQKIEHNNLVS